MYIKVWVVFLFFNCYDCCYFVCCWQRWTCSYIPRPSASLAGLSWIMANGRYSQVSAKKCTNIGLGELGQGGRSSSHRRDLMLVSAWMDPTSLIVIEEIGCKPHVNYTSVTCWCLHQQQIYLYSLVLYEKYLIWDCWGKYLQIFKLSFQRMGWKLNWTYKVFIRLLSHARFVCVCFGLISVCSAFFPTWETASTH